MIAIGRRFIIVEGVERWKEADTEPIVQALANPAPETTVVFFAREESRAKAPKKLHEAVERAGGDVSVESTVKPWELPKWVVAEGHRIGVELDSNAAKALVAHVGDVRDGRISVLVDEREVVIHDPEIVARLANAAADSKSKGV